MSIHQIQIAFSAEEDRLLMRLSTTTREEYRAWLTRRFVRLFWPNLLRLMQAEPLARAAGSTEAANALLGMQREQALRSADMSKPFGATEKAEQVRFPLGEVPFVVARATLAQRDDGNIAFTMLPLSSQGVDVVLSRDLTLTLMQMLQDAVSRAEWDIVLEMPGATLGDTSPDERPALLN